MHNGLYCHQAYTDTSSQASWDVTSWPLSSHTASLLLLMLQQVTIRAGHHTGMDETIASDDDLL